MNCLPYDCLRDAGQLRTSALALGGTGGVFGLGVRCREEPVEDAPEAYPYCCWCCWRGFWCALTIPSTLPTLIRVTPTPKGETSRSRTDAHASVPRPTTVSSAQKGGARDGTMTLWRMMRRDLKSARGRRKFLATMMGCSRFKLIVSDQIPPSRTSTGAAG